MSDGQLKGLIPRTRELGRLRMGERGAKGQPVKRTTWRLTSPSEDLLTVAAGLYGGTVAVWDGAPTQGRQYELATDAESLEVLIPLTDNAVSQAFEMWSGGGCARRCDGERMTDDAPCACPADSEARMALAKEGKACSPHTRFNVLLPDVPDLGFWRLETSGYNAAVELPGSLALYRGLAMQYGAADGLIVRAHLAIEARTSKRDGQTRHYTVPVIRTPNITPAVLMTGEAPALPSTGAAQVEGGPQAALPAGRGAAEGPPSPSAAPPASREFTTDQETLAPTQWRRDFLRQVGVNKIPDELVVKIVQTATAGRGTGPVPPASSSAMVGQIRKDEMDAAAAALAAALVPQGA